MTAEKRLGRQYHEQFGDVSIVNAYEHRPPYPAAVFTLLRDLISASPRIVLDLGCGTGDIARPLAALVDAVDAIDSSARMTARAARLPGGDRPNLHWATGRAEEAAFPHSEYGLVTAGESLHWMDWESLFPRLRAVSGPLTPLAIVGRHYPDHAWSDELMAIARRYNTNREYDSYNLIDELAKRDLFEVIGNECTAPAVFTQSVEHFIESIHSQAGFSRDRMSPQDVAAFDAEVERLLRPHATQGELTFQVVGQVVWGQLQRVEEAGRKAVQVPRMELLPMGFYGSAKDTADCSDAPRRSIGQGHRRSAVNGAGACGIVDFGRPDAAAQFVRSLHETGFAVIANHPIPLGMVSAIYGEWRAFFHSDRKHAYPHDENRPGGYYPFEGASPVSGSFACDRKEFFHVYPDGVYPIEVPDTALRYLGHALAFGITLADWIDRHSPAEITARFSMPLADMLAQSTASVLRIQHYLPLAVQELASGLRAVAHTDINLMTVLPSPSVDGLQLFDPASHSWRDIPCATGSVVVNGGEMLEAVSGGYFPATEHRVITPRPDADSGSRFSLPLFLSPPDNVIVAPGRTAAEFRRARVTELARKGWKVVAGGNSDNAGA